MSIRYPGWYRTVEPTWATTTFDFPADPTTGDNYIAWDGSGWEFNVHGGGVWDCLSYAKICMCCGAELAAPRDEFCPECTARGCYHTVRAESRD